MRRGILGFFFSSKLLLSIKSIIKSERRRHLFSAAVVGKLALMHRVVLLTMIHDCSLLSGILLRCLTESYRIFSKKKKLDQMNFPKGNFVKYIEVDICHNQ